MPTHKILADLDVGGEVQSTSLDINGNADISGTLKINSVYTANTDANDLQIGSTTTGNGGLSIITGNTNTGGIFFGDNDNNDAGRIKYIHSSNSLLFDTNRTNALTIDSSQNATFAGNATVGGDFTSSGYVQSHGILYIRNSVKVVNKADNGWLNLAARDTSGSEAVYNLDNIGTITVDGKIETAGEIEGGSLDINGNADISGTLVAGNTEVQDLDISGTATGDGSGLTDLNGSEITTGTIAAARVATLNQNTTGSSGSCTGNAATATALTSGNKTIAGILDITDTTDSSDATGDTGALRCEGGASIAKKLYVGSTITGSADVIAFSDRKLKENIETLDGKKVLDMRGVSFTRKDTGAESSGVIAQEIQKVAPELVHDTEGTLGVAYGNLVGYLIEAIKDQQKQIDELKEMCSGCSR